MPRVTLTMPIRHSSTRGPTQHGLFGSRLPLTSEHEQAGGGYQPPDAAPNASQFSRTLWLNVTSYGGSYQSANEVLIQMGLGPRHSSEVPLYVGNNAVIVPQQPEDFGDPIQDEHSPPHPLIRPQPSEGAEEGDSDMQEVEEVCNPVVHPTRLARSLQVGTSMLVFQPLLGIHRGLASHPCGGDGLSVALVHHISSCEHPGNTRHRVLGVQDVARVIHPDFTI